MIISIGIQQKVVAGHIGKKFCRSVREAQRIRIKIRRFESCLRHRREEEVRAPLFETQLDEVSSFLGVFKQIYGNIKWILGNHTRII